MQIFTRCQSQLSLFRPIYLEDYNCVVKHDTWIFTHTMVDDAMSGTPVEFSGVDDAKGT